MPPSMRLELTERLRQVMAAGRIEVPERFGGTGGAGTYMEHLLGMVGGSSDTPDDGRWELKTHTGGLVTLSHLEHESGLPLGVIIDTYGYPCRNPDERCFRHTVRGDRLTTGKQVSGWFLRIEEGTWDVIDHAGVCVMRWDEDAVVNAVVQKLRRLVFIEMERVDGRVFDLRHGFLFWELRPSRFATLVRAGKLMVDVDCKRRAGGGVRNHGTKFRVTREGLTEMYRCCEGICGAEWQEGAALPLLDEPDSRLF